MSLFAKIRNRFHTLKENSQNSDSPNDNTTNNSNSEIVESSEVKKDSPKSEYHHQEIAQLEEPMITLLEQLKPNFDHGLYYLIIGDDTSGRIPTLVMHQVVDYISEHQNLPKVPTTFVQSGRVIDRGKIKLQVENLKSRYKPLRESPKVLIVTEYISSGRSINKLTDALNLSGIDFDIATIQTFPADYQQEFRSSLNPQQRIYTGFPEGIQSPISGGNVGSPNIHGKYYITGLEAARVGGNPEVSVIKSNPYVRLKTQQAREDVKTLSGKLINHLYPQEVAA